MNSIICWCNSNEGFISAILSLCSLLLSIIAIVISIATSRLPYKRKLLLSSKLTYAVMCDKKMILMGIEASIVNVGNVPVNISYLGFGWKEKRKIIKVQPINRKSTGEGVIKPQEISNNIFYINEIEDLIRKINNENKKIYVLAIDASGKTYKKAYYKTKHLKELINS